MSLVDRTIGLDRLEYFFFLDVFFLQFKTETDTPLLLVSLGNFQAKGPSE